MHMPCRLALEGVFHAWGRDLVRMPFFFLLKIFHAVAGAHHPLGALADASDDGGRFSYAQKGQRHHPS